MTATQTALKVPAAPVFCVERIRADFPILKLKVGDRSLVYLDNAASSQMPQQVIDRLVRYWTTQHANVNRGVHYLSETATSAFEEARGKIQRFIGAREDREVIFTSGTTDAINAVTNGYGRKFIGAGDEIILTMLEHHSKHAPHVMVAESKDLWNFHPNQQLLESTVARFWLNLVDVITGDQHEFGRRFQCIHGIQYGICAGEHVERVVEHAFGSHVDIGQVRESQICWHNMIV